MEDKQIRSVAESGLWRTLGEDEPKQDGDECRLIGVDGSEWYSVAKHTPKSPHCEYRRFVEPLPVNKQDGGGEWLVVNAQAGIDVDETYEVLKPDGTIVRAQGYFIPIYSKTTLRFRPIVKTVHSDDVGDEWVQLDGTVDVDPSQVYEVSFPDGRVGTMQGNSLPKTHSAGFCVRIPRSRRETKDIPSKALTDKVASGVAQVPYSGIEAVGSIFIEGLKYGKGNWKLGVNDKDYQEQRCEHAIRHLTLWANGDRQENHLAKVAWFCLTQIELERLEGNGL